MVACEAGWPIAWVAEESAISRTTAKSRASPARQARTTGGWHDGLQPIVGLGDRRPLRRRTATGPAMPGAGARRAVERRSAASSAGEPSAWCVASLKGPPHRSARTPADRRQAWLGSASALETCCRAGGSHAPRNLANLLRDRRGGPPGRSNFDANRISLQRR